MKFKGLLVAAALVGLMATVARANTIDVILTGVTPIGGGLYQWDYDANLTADAEVVTGSYFTIYDFRNIVGTPTFTDSSWSVSTPLTGDTPPFTAPPDDSGITNITVKYTGTLSIGGPAKPLGTLSVITPWNQQVGGVFSSTDVTNGEVTHHVSEVNVAAVPLPAAAWASFGMLGLLGIARMRKAWR